MMKDKEDTLLGNEEVRQFLKGFRDSLIVLLAVGICLLSMYTFYHFT